MGKDEHGCHASKGETNIVESDVVRVAALKEAVAIWKADGFTEHGYTKIRGNYEHFIKIMHEPVVVGEKVDPETCDLTVPFKPACMGGQEWRACGKSYISYREAEEWASSLGEGWRIPSIEELRKLIKGYDLRSLLADGDTISIWSIITPFMPGKVVNVLSVALGFAVKHELADRANMMAMAVRGDEY